MSAWRRCLLRFDLSPLYLHISLKMRMKKPSISRVFSCRERLGCSLVIPYTTQGLAKTIALEFLSVAHAESQASLRSSSMMHLGFNNKGGKGHEIKFLRVGSDRHPLSANFGNG